MKEKQFAGHLNSKSRYGQSYSDYSALRLFKWCRIQDLSPKYNPLRFKWYKKNKMYYPSWGKGLYSSCGEVLHSQRMWNDGCSRAANKKVRLMRWKK